ncbi:hypothetical protein PROFUN_09278 [Planoprotostelium fungivorum]|uniref:Uncharacterized protein n=1 Tax=Planoprotostelium fungivorum TaxID=1890364 RepID=A0A2P6NKV7_9EUKA|nr:hypothetical protein PROFUN_09278 [Planoprotostelium fungivorum]
MRRRANEYIGALSTPHRINPSSLRRKIHPQGDRRVRADEMDEDKVSCSSTATGVAFPVVEWCEKLTQG